MQILHNRISNQELKKKMLSEKDKRITISFYKYFSIADPKDFRDKLYILMIKFKIFGRVYVAYEGINAQISIPSILYKKFKMALYSFALELNNIRINIALDDDGKSFWVLRLKVRKRIVADGINIENFNFKNVGHYLKAEEVNNLLDDPNVLLVDMRNHYEYQIGHFNNAVEIPAKTFRDQLPMAVKILKPYQHKKIIMYCTGGIRCEKATAWMKYNNFTNIYHIEGGIIEYIRRAKEQGLPILFKGKIFVFDNRMAERISNDILSHCEQCGIPCDYHTNCMNKHCNALFIQCLKCCKKNYNFCVLCNNTC